MKFYRFIPLALLLAAAAVVSLPAQPAPAKARPGKTGAVPTPRHRLLAAPQFKPVMAQAVPAAVAYVPSKLSMWLNDTYGDCVTAEEAFAKACTGIFISDATVKTWASAHNALNGAELEPIMKGMATAGFAQDGNHYNDGGYASVDYSNEAVLQAALAVGVVKIGIDSNALPDTAGYHSGWVGIGGKPGQFNNEDHCVALAGFGPASYLFAQLHVALPATLNPTTNGYLLFTWNTIGFIDHAWIMSTVGEAWVRNPTTIIVGTGTPSPDPPLNPPTPVPPTPPPNPPTPTPTPTPGATTITLSSDMKAGSYKLAPANAKEIDPVAFAAWLAEVKRVMDEGQAIINQSKKP